MGTAERGTDMTRLELLQGTLELLVLRTIGGAPKHGYEIARAIKTSSRDMLQVEEGALYPALHRLEAKGWVESSWGRSENKRRAKFYSLTPAGHEALRAEATTWQRYVEAVGLVLDDRPETA